MDWVNIIVQLVVFISYALIALSATGILLLIVYITYLLINRTSWLMLDCYGGIKTFRQYREWYMKNKLHIDK
jgi:hypothetical protein